MCPLCITAGTLYLASASAGSAGGLAAVAAKVMRRRKGRNDHPAPGATVGTNDPAAQRPRRIPTRCKQR